MDGKEAILAITYQGGSVFMDRLTRPAYHNSGGIGLLPSHSYTFRTESQNLPQEAEAPAPPMRGMMNYEVAWIPGVNVLA